MSDQRIPREVNPFKTYINNSNARQLAINPDTTNPWWTDYGWTAGQSGDYEDYNTELNDLFTLYSNDATHTPVVTKDINDLIKNFTNFVRTEKLLEKIIASSVVTNTDASIFNITLVRDTPTSLSSKIETKPWASVEHSGPGTFDIKCRSAEDESRPSIDRDNGADSLEYAYAIFEGPPSEELYMNPDERKVFTKAISKKAHFSFNAGAENRRKILVIYFRWTNLSHPEFAGDWTEMVMVNIS